MRNLDEFIRDLYKKHKVFGTSKICVQTPEIFVIMRGMGLSIEIAKNEIINDDVNLAWTQDWNIDRGIRITG